MAFFILFQLWLLVYTFFTAVFMLLLSDLVFCLLLLTVSAVVIFTFVKSFEGFFASLSCCYLWLLLVLLFFDIHFLNLFFFSLLGKPYSRGIIGAFFLFDKWDYLWNYESSWTFSKTLELSLIVYAFLRGVCDMVFCISAALLFGFGRSMICLCSVIKVLVIFQERFSVQ